MGKLYVYMIVFASIFYGACIDRYILPPVESQEIVYVDAEINPNNSQHFIRLNQSMDVGSQVIIPIKDALVYLKGAKGWVYDFYWSSNLYYEYIGQLDTSDRYSLHIVLSDSREISSTLQSIPPQVKLDSIGVEIKKSKLQNPDGAIYEESVVEFYTHLDPSKNTADHPQYLRLGAESVFYIHERKCGNFHNPKPCYVYNYKSNFEIHLLDLPKNSISKHIKQRVFSKLQDFQLAENYGVKITAKSYSKDIYEYWRKLKVLFDQNGGPTSPIPGRIESPNLSISSGEVLGAFALIREDETYKILGPRSYGLSEPFPLCGSPYGYLPEPWPRECCNCLLLPNSTTSKPYYWP
jgi:hypothetical protein